MPKNNPSKASLITEQRRKREKDLRYNAILTGAERLFCEQGYSGTKIEEISISAEVAVGTVYKYFHNKEDLMIRLLDKIAFDFQSIFKEARRKGKTPIEGFQILSQALSEDFWRKNRSHLIILFRESTGLSPDAQARRRSILDRVKEDFKALIIEILKENNARDLTAAEAISITLEGVFERIAYRYVIWEDRVDEVGPVIHQAIEFVRGGLTFILKKIRQAENEK